MEVREMESESAAARVTTVDPLTVGKAFVLQYYHILHNVPEHLHRFYQEHSKVGRVGLDGVMRHFSTLQGITEVLKTMSYGDFRSAEITSYDVQESHGGGFVLAVAGYFTLNERLKRKFSQTFFLAPQENGYFVLNDIFRFVNEPKAMDGGLVSGSHSPANAPTGTKQAQCVSVNPVRKEVSKPLNDENASVAKKNVMVPATVNGEVPDDSLKVSDPEDGLEDVRQKSYASVLAKDKSGVAVGSSLSPKQIFNDQEHQVPLVPSFEQIQKEQGHEASSNPSPVIASDAVSEAADATENGHNHGLEAVAEGTSIYVKHLPIDATIDMLEAEFKQFGVICSDGIQVVNQKGCGYPYGFVEFVEADAALKAIEASPVRVGGQRAFVEEKLSTSRGKRGNANATVGMRGRGNYGYGNSYRRGGGRSFNNRRGTEDVARTNTY